MCNNVVTYIISFAATNDKVGIVPLLQTVDNDNSFVIHDWLLQKYINYYCFCFPSPSETVCFLHLPLC